MPAVQARATARGLRRQPAARAAGAGRWPAPRAPPLRQRRFEASARGGEEEEPRGRAAAFPLVLVLWNESKQQRRSTAPNTLSHRLLRSQNGCPTCWRAIGGSACNCLHKKGAAYQSAYPRPTGRWPTFEGGECFEVRTIYCMIDRLLDRSTAFFFIFFLSTAPCRSLTHCI